MNNYIRRKLIMGLTALLISSSCTVQKKEQDNHHIYKNVPNDYIKHPPYIQSLERLIYRINFSSQDSTLIKQDSLQAALYFRLDIKRSLTLEDTVTVRLHDLSYYYSSGGERIKSHDIGYFKKRYGHILSQIEKSYNAYDRFYLLPQGQYKRTKPDTTKIDYKDYFMESNK